MSYSFEWLERYGGVEQLGRVEIRKRWGRRWNPVRIVETMTGESYFYFRDFSI